MDGTTAFKADGVSYKVRDLPATFSAIEFENGVVSDSALEVSKKAIPESVIAADLDGNYFDAIYSILKWNVTKHGMIEEDDLDDIDDNELFGEDFKTTNLDKIDTKNFDLVGVASLSDIDEDNVVYVYVGGDYITKVEVGTEVVKGEVTRIQGDKITVAGKAYEKSAYADSNMNFNFAVEQEVELYLDYAGDIYDAKLLEGEADNLAILLESAAGSPGLNGTDTKFKLFLADGTTKTFVADQDEMVDDGVIEEVTGGAYAFTTTYSALATGDVLVEYGVNKDGEIVQIDLYDASELTYDTNAKVSAKGFLGGYKIAADATIFTGADIDAGKTFVEDDYGVSTLDKILDATYAVVLYYVNEKKGVVDLIVIEGAGDSSDAVYGVLNDTFKTSDWDYGVEVLVDGVFKEYGATTNVTDMSVLYKITFNTDGEAVMTTTEPMTGYDNVPIIDFNNNRAYKEGDGSVAVDKDAFVYLYEDGEWTVGDTGDIKGEKASFFATDSDEPAIANVVLVWISAKP
jgi:hypothetical protein